MSGGIYTSVSGASVNLAALEVIANNIANANTAGFLRDQLRFDTVLGGALPYARTVEGRIDLSPGSSQPTGNPLNATLDGDAFFAVEGPGGTELYTKRGDFRVNAQGVLTLPSGVPVLGTGGKLEIPAGVTAQLASNGDLTTSSGVIGRLKVVTFESPELLTKAGESLLAAPPEAQPSIVATPQLAPGFEQDANVDLSGELVSLIVAQRSFEASMNALRINDELTASLIEAQR